MLLLNDYFQHAPASCAMVREWKHVGGYFESDNDVDDDASSKLLKLITKKCSKCGMRLTKNGGCIHFTCKESAGGCGHQVSLYFIIVYELIVH